MRATIKKLIRFFRPVYWPLIKAYFILFSPETKGARIILTYKNEILFIRHSYGLKYNFPGGGIGKSEDPEDGVKREVREELGIDLDKVHYITSLVPDVAYEYRKNTISIFTAELQTKDININNLEIADAQWLPLTNPPSLGHVAYQIFQLYKTTKV